MPPILWTTQINFASALLLHSCITVILKETFNVLEVSRRLLSRFWNRQIPRRSDDRLKDQIRTSIVLDGYTSIFSHDLEGELAELYFTNTGFILLAVSLASSVAMNLLLSSMFLNAFVATIFGVAFLASLINGDKEITLPILALRRAGRFIWSDTPVVNFFSLIYIATVLQGQTTLRLQDYVTFRGIAVLELVFMKAKLAASSPQKQIRLMRQLVESEWVAVNSVSLLPTVVRYTSTNADTAESETGNRLSQPAVLHCSTQQHGPIHNNPEALGNAVQDSCWLPFWLLAGLTWSNRLPGSRGRVLHRRTGVRMEGLQIIGRRNASVRLPCRIFPRRLVGTIHPQDPWCAASSTWESQGYIPPSNNRCRDGFSVAFQF